MTLHRMIHMTAIFAILASLSLLIPSKGKAGSIVGQPVEVSSDSAATTPSTDSRPTLKPGPAWRTIGGTVKQIKGAVYIVEDYDGNQVQLYVSRDTKRLRGGKKVGDRVRAEITRDGFANSIQ